MKASVNDKIITEPFKALDNPVFLPAFTAEAVVFIAPISPEAWVLVKGFGAVCPGGAVDVDVTVTSDVGVVVEKIVEWAEMVPGLCDGDNTGVSVKLRSTVIKPLPAEQKTAE